MERPAWVREELERDETGAFMLRPGAMIPGTRYRVVRWLGDGSMGVVYQAEHIDIERQVAVKILRLTTGPRNAIAAFRQEARVASRVGSEYIAQVFDFAELPDGRLMFAMEYVNGKSLSRSIRKAALPVERVVPILRQVCKGLAAAHDTGIIHRDIKPDNIMLEAEPRADRVRLVDFGVATISDTVHRTVEDLVGTPFYVAPEVVEGANYDHHVDLYSLGCSAYEMLTGVPPFPYENVERVLQAQALETPRHLRELAPGVPAPIAEVVMRCLEKRPSNRFDNAHELEAALVEAQIEAHIVTAWDDLPLPDVDPDRRAKMLAGLTPTQPHRSRWWLVAAAAALVGLTAAVAWQLRPDPEPAVGAVDPALQQVERLAAAARGAAKRHAYVYPSADAPGSATAYTSLLELESIDHAEAAIAAKALREELSTELRELGAAFWKPDHPSKIAADFYAQSLLFDPDDAVAIERAFKDQDELAALAKQAAERDFSDDELMALDAMAIAAERDSVLRRQRLARMRARRSGANPETVDPRLAELAELETQVHPLDPSHTLGGLDAAEASAPQGGEEASEGDEGDADANRDAARARRELSKGSAALARGDNAGAKAAFERALAADPRSARAHDGLGRAYFNTSNFDRAVKHGRRAVALAPRNADYRMHLGDAYYRQGDKQHALEHYGVAAKRGHAGAQRRVDKVRGQL